MLCARFNHRTNFAFMLLARDAPHLCLTSRVQSGMYSDFENHLQNGDVVEVVGPFPCHVGVYAAGRGFIHNQKGNCVVLTNLQTFSGGLPIRVIARVNGGWFRREQVVQRALTLMGKRYDLLNFNCEHAAYYAATGVARSPQLGWAVLGLAVFGLVWAFRK